MTMVPPTLRRYVLAPSVLEDTYQLLHERGQQGLEAVVVWIGGIVDSENAKIVGVIRPGQVAYAGEDGCAVEVPPDALSELISMLPEDLFVLARVHTHPGAAYHSPVDDTNMLISHNGAISIVVPNFAQEPVRLENCSVNVLRHGIGWVELPAAEVAERFTSP
jgi:hypothetical protein